jgi:hypothetical protein
VKACMVDGGWWIVELVRRDQAVTLATARDPSFTHLLSLITRHSTACARTYFVVLPALGLITPKRVSMEDYEVVQRASDASGAKKKKIG